ncbi:MAG: TIGR01777 family oxidoreductase [bacterium JZ-2024 1]
MRTVVIGGSGFIGMALVKRLIGEQRHVVVTTRDAKRTRARIPAESEPFQWDARSAEALIPILERSDAVVNLAGASVAVRWTPMVKDELVRSRVQTTNVLVEAIRRTSRKPSVYLQASAVGYYGYTHSRDRELDENAPPGNDFLANLCRDWESASEDLDATGTRRIVVRVGIVLSREGGALARLLLPFRLGLGGPLGSGNQPFPWVSLADVVGAIVFLMGNREARGVFNLVAPHAVTNREFTRVLARVIHRPAFLPVPSFALTALFGEMAEVMLLNGQRAIPERLLQLGYQFTHPDLETALKAVLSGRD